MLVPAFLHHLFPSCSPMWNAITNIHMADVHVKDVSCKNDVHQHQEEHAIVDEIHGSTSLTTETNLVCTLPPQHEQGAPKTATTPSLDRPQCVTPVNHDDMRDDYEFHLTNRMPTNYSYLSLYSVGPHAQAKSEHYPRNVSVQDTLYSSDPWTLEDFEPTQKRRLGSGKFGSVSLYKYNQNPFALKKMIKEFDVEQQREVEIATRLSHAHILPCYGYFQTRHDLYLVLEYADQGDLTQHAEFLQYKTKLVLLQQVAQALSYLHQQCIAHRDVKLENVLLCTSTTATTKKDDTHFVAKLSDFGSSIYYGSSPQRRTVCGTLLCLPSAVLACQLYPNATYHAAKTDAWSLGVLLYETVVGEDLFESEQDILRYRDDNYLLTTKAVQYSSDFQDLLADLLQANETLRVLPEQILEHEGWTTPKKKPKKRSRNSKNRQKRAKRGT